MRYLIERVDIARQAQDITIPSDCSGIALDVRRGQRPLGFLMADRQPGSTLRAADLTAWIEKEIALECLNQQETETIADGPMPQVTIVICTKDHPDLLNRCLTAIHALDLPEGVVLPEILVIDNASVTTQTRDVAARFPGTRYALEPKTGLNFARNRALQEAKGEILAFIDDDAVVDPAWMRGLYQAWAMSPSAGAYAGQTLPFALETEAQIVVERIGGFRKGFLPIVFGREHPSDPLYPCSTAFGNGCNMAFKVEVMRGLKGFDIGLDMGAALPGGGDLDALYQVVRHGHDLVYQPQMLVLHEHRRDMKGLRRQIRRSWGMGCMAFLTKIRDFDPEMRPKANTFIRWWIRAMLRELVSPRPKAPTMPKALLLQQFVGACIALTGTYDRAKLLAAKIAAQSELSK